MAYETENLNIKVPRGDSASIPFTFTDSEGEPYIFDDGQYARLDVYPVKGAEPVITKTAPKSEQSEYGTVFFVFSPEETDIPRGEYIYTLRTFGADDTEIDTRVGFPDAAVFEIK